MATDNFKQIKQKPTPRPIFIPPCPTKDIRFVYLLIKEGYSVEDAFKALGYSEKEILKNKEDPLILSASLQRRYIENQDTAVLDIEPIEVMLTSG